MSDFVLGILKACEKVYPQADVRYCFFHLGQSLYRHRHIQKEGLQRTYNDDQDRRIKKHTHMVLSLAFVPIADVPTAFRKLSQAWREEDDFKPIMKYFHTFYVNGTPGRTRTAAAGSSRASVPPRYSPRIWNQYDAALRKQHRTNNVSEAWHNRFQVVVGRHHPDLFSALKELQKEQADTEAMIAELSLGWKVKGCAAEEMGGIPGKDPEGGGRI